jgi:transposase-like protein
VRVASKKWAAISADAGHPFALCTAHPHTREKWRDALQTARRCDVPVGKLMPGSIKTGGDTHDTLRSEIVARLLRGELGMHEACERYALTPEGIGDWVRDFRRSTLKAFDEHVRATLSRQGVDMAAFSATELTGTLDEVAVSDLIQTLDLSRRDGEISVTHAGLQSRLWCSGGEVVAAESGQLSGEAALYRILALEEGDVVADFRPVRRERTIWKPTPVLLLDGARRKDECHRLRTRLGRERYAPGSNLPSVGATFTRAEIELLRAFDGPRSVGDALAASPLGDLETLTAFANLVKRECLLPTAELADAPQVSPADVISLRPALVSLLALAPHVSRASADARRVRVGLILAGGLLAAASALWLLLPRPVSGHDTARDARMLTPTPALGAPEASASVPALALPTPALVPVVAPAPVPEPSTSPRQTRSQEASAPRANAARVRVPRPPAAAAFVAPPEPPRTPRMQIIEDRNPSMRVLE